jgi:glycosyltransferase involved in cell wall biosynthesis
MHNDAPVRVSVVVPTRARPELLREALASIRAAESPTMSLEILVCDNGNGEGAAPAQEYGARYLTVTRQNAAAARNAGILAATGHYIAFLDDDDLWLPTGLSPRIALLEAHPELDAAVGQTMMTDEQRRPTCEPWPVSLPADGDVFQEFLREYPQIGATIVRTRVRDTVGLQDEGDDADGDEDWDWHLRLALKHRVGFVPHPCVLFRQRAAGTYDGLLWRRLGVMRNVLFRNLARAGRRRPRGYQYVRLIISHQWGFYLSFVRSALRHAAAGDRRSAWRATGYAVASSPVHAALGLFRPGQTGQILGTLLLGWPVDPSLLEQRPLEIDPRKAVPAPADRPAPPATEAREDEQTVSGEPLLREAAR